MSWFERVAGSRTGRLVWGLVALAAAALMAGSFVFAGKGLRSAEEGARSRAVAWSNTVLFKSLTPQMVNRPMIPRDYRALMSAVGAGILSDDRVARVRVWQPDGRLVFSSDQRDDVWQYVASGDTQIRAAASGKTVSLLTAATVGPKTGLAGSDERLYETFVSLHLPGEDGVSAVAEIDQRYSAIRDSVYRVWLPAQLGLGALTLFALLTFVLSFRSGRRRRAAARGPAPRALAREEADVPFASMEAAAELARTKGALHQAEERARAAERALKERDSAGADERHLKDRLAASEKRLQEAMDAYRRLEQESKRAALRVPELEAEVRRLTEVAAHVAPPTAPVPRAEDAQIVERLRTMEEERQRLTAELQRLQAALAEREAELALTRAGAEADAQQSTETAEQVRQAEQRALAAEQRASVAEELLRQRDSAYAALEEASRQANEIAEKTAATELRRVQQEVDQVSLKLGETEAALAGATARAASLEAVARQVEEDRKAAAAELERLQAALAEREAKLTRLRESLAAKQAETETARTDAGARVAELEALVGGLEDQRRRDVSELARAQEVLTNTQFELTQAIARANDAEGRLRQLESEGVGHVGPEEPRDAPESAPATPIEPDVAGGLAPEHMREEATIASRLARILPRRHEHEPEPEPEAAAAPAGAEDEPAAPSPSEEGLSLRERLTRAAAARHRVRGPGES